MQNPICPFKLKVQFGRPSMPDNTRFDPFHPQQPRIPGVPESEAKPKAAPPPPPEPLPAPGPAPSRQPLPWIAMTVAGILIAVAVLLWWGRGSSGQPEHAAGPAAISFPPISNDSAREKGLPTGPGKIATPDELAQPWSHKRFLFRNRPTGETVPAMLVSLPGGEYWAFSLRAPFGNCELEYVTDLAKLQSEYQFQGDHPMVADPCSRSVFDLTRYGATPSGSLVRGEIEKGTAIRPPLAIEVRVEDNEVRAIRMEE